MQRQLAEQVPAAKHAARIGQALAGQQSAVVLVDDVEQGIAVVNAYAAEHLEIQTADAEQVAGRITNAGAIFVGPWSPVSLGDYCAGSTHVLPTAGCACHSSGLNVKSFLKAVNVVNYSRAALAEVARDVEVFADAEDLPAHGAAVSATVPRPHERHIAPTAGPAAAAPGAGRRGPVRGPAARRPGPAQRQREPVPAERGGGGRDRAWPWPRRPGR